MILKRVLVLLSTYNGEKYLTTQLDSVLNQTYNNVSILVRDDGSTDNTLKILEEYKNKGYLEWYQGENKKPAKSFLELLNRSGNYEYYAFCDQDDFWQPNKIEKAIDALEGEKDSIPLLYCSATTLVDENLLFLSDGHKKNYRLTFEESLVQSISPGCTFVFNKEAKQIISKVDDNDFYSMHDYLLICAVFGIGKVYYDEDSYILYRQHSSNVIGTQHNKVSILKNRLSRFLFSKQQNTRLKTARTIKKIIYNQLSESKKNNLDILINYQDSLAAKFKLLRNNEIKMLNSFDNLIFKILVVLNKI